MLFSLQPLDGLYVPWNRRWMQKKGYVAERTGDIRRSLNPAEADDRRLIEGLLRRDEIATLAVTAASWIKESIAQRSNPIGLLELQRELAENALTLQERRTELVRAIAEGDAAQRESLALVTKTLFTIRGVADGMAWRVFDYDRLVIRQLSQHQATGYLQADSFAAELAAARQWIDRTGDLVVINDLTNCLRFADLSAVSATAVTLREVKAGRGSAKSGHASRQRAAVERRVNLLRQGLAESPSRDLVTLVRPELDARNHLATVSRLIEESSEDGSADARLTAALAAQVVRPTLNAPVAAANPFVGDAPVITDTTLTLFDIWSPNMPPFSVFPYPIRDRAAVMLGMVEVICYCNLNEVVAALKARGLTTTLPSFEALQHLARLEPWQQLRRQHEASLVVSDPNSDRELRIPMSALKQLTGEFLDEDSFADLTVATLKGAPSTAQVMPGFANENRIWN